MDFVDGLAGMFAASQNYSGGCCRGPQYLSKGLGFRV